MDKRPVYVGAIPLDLDWLQPQRNIEIAFGFLLQAAFGTSTLIDGLAVMPTQPNSMKVQVGPGSIIVATTVDTVASGFGSLPVDNSDALVKMGINLLPTTMAALTPPSTAGQSQNWLIEAQFLEQDAGATVLPFYNSSNPALPYTGPANAGTSNTTARTQSVQLQWKPGTPAASGQQLTPAPDAGWVGVAVVTVNNGDTALGGLRISRAPNSPIVGTKLSNTRIKLFGNLSLYVSSAGNDNNSGLSSNVPFASLQAAINSVYNQYDLNGFGVTINVGSGTFSQVSISGQPTGYGASSFLNVIGAGSSTIINSTGSGGSACVAAVSGANVSLSALQFTGITGMLSSSGAVVNAGAGLVYGSLSGQGIYCSAATVNLNGSYAITGGSQYHYNCTGGGQIVAYNTITCTLTGTPAFSANFAHAYQAAIQIVSSSGTLSFSGSATGQRYLAEYGGVVATNGGGASYIPGSTAGTSATGYYS